LGSIPTNAIGATDPFKFYRRFFDWLILAGKMELVYLANE
jgi:hypothetical protein